MKLGVLIGAGGVVIILVMLVTMIAIPVTIICYRIRIKKRAAMWLNGGTTTKDATPRIYRRRETQVESPDITTQDITIAIC